MDESGRDLIPRTRKCSPDWWLIGLLLLPVLYFLPEFLGFNYFAGIDTSRLNMPLRYFDRQAFASGALPLWNPYMFAGFPGLAESESGVFYPGNIFIHMPGNFFHWYSIEVIAHFMIAAAGFYYWMRFRGHEIITSAFLAATYATTPFLIFHITAFGLFTSIVWLPWYLLFFEHGMRGKHPVKTGLWLALFLGLMLMAGSVQAAYLGVLGILLYALGSLIAQPDGKSRLQYFLRALAVLIPCILAPVIALVQVLPTAELTQFSERKAFDDIEFYRMGTWLKLSRLNSLVTFPALDNPADIQDYGSSLCFIGALPFALGVSSLSMWKIKGRLLFPLIFGGIIALFLGFGLNLPGYSILTEIPPFSMFRYPGRHAFVALTLLLPMAAPALDLIYRRADGTRLKEERKAVYFMLVGAAIVLLIGLAGLSMPGTVKLGALPSIIISLLTIIVCVSFAFGKQLLFRRLTLLSSMISLLVISLALQLLLNYPFTRILVQERPKFEESLTLIDDIKSGFPSDDEIPRILQAGSHLLLDPDAINSLGFSAQKNIYDNLSGNAAGLGNVTSLRGLTPLNQNNWKLIVRDTLQSRMDNVLNISNETGAPKIPDEISMRIIRILGADILLLEGDDWLVPGFELWRTDLELPYHDGLCAYRAVDGFVPDAYFVEQVTYGVGTYPGMLQWLGTSSLDVSQHAAVELTDENMIDPPDFFAPGSAVLSREREMNMIRFDVMVEGSADQYGFLVTGENRLPGWNAYINGNPASIHITNHLLSGVFVPSGHHTVELSYQPKSFLYGMIGSLTGLLIWAILILAVFAIHKRMPASVVPPADNE